MLEDEEMGGSGLREAGSFLMLFGTWVILPPVFRIATRTGLSIGLRVSLAG